MIYRFSVVIAIVSVSALMGVRGHCEEAAAGEGDTSQPVEDAPAEEATAPADPPPSDDAAASSTEETGSPVSEEQVQTETGAEPEEPENVPSEDTPKSVDTPKSEVRGTTSKESETPVPVTSSQEDDSNLTIRYGQEEAKRAALYFDKTYKSFRWMHVLGTSLFASGIVMAIAGAGMIEGDGNGDLGSAGLALVTVGIFHFIVGSFFLGFSRTLDSIPAAPTLAEEELGDGSRIIRF